MDGYPNLGLGLEPPAARLRRPIWLPIAVIGFLQKKIAVIGPSKSKARENFQKKTSTFPKSNHSPGSSLCYSRHAFFFWRASPFYLKYFNCLMQLVMTAGVEQEGNCPGMDESAVQCLADELALTRHNQMANKIT